MGSTLSLTGWKAELHILRLTAERHKRSAFRPVTNSNHISMIRRYIKFCFYFHLTDIPSTVDTMCCYIEHLAQTLRSPKAINNYMSAIKLLHKLVGVSTAMFDSFDIHRMLRAIDITSDHVPQQKVVLSARTITLLCQWCKSQGALGPTIHCAILFGYWGMLRKSNLVPSRPHDYDKHATWAGGI